MKLISCDHCAVMLDADKLYFPTDVWNHEDECIDPRKAGYNQKTKTFNAYVRCPVCENEVFNTEREV